MSISLWRKGETEHISTKHGAFVFGNVNWAKKMNREGGVNMVDDESWN